MHNPRETELPPPSTRWTIRRKAALVRAVRSGLLTVEQATGQYRLSEQELRAWERDLDRHGLYGLRATRLQVYQRSKGSHRERSRALKPIIATVGAIVKAAPQSERQRLAHTIETYAIRYPTEFRNLKNGRPAESMRQLFCELIQAVDARPE